MKKHPVSIVKYEGPYDSVNKAAYLYSGLSHLPTKATVLIKPGCQVQRNAGICRMIFGR